MEHHSNIVPWQMLCERTGATLKWFGVTDEGRLDVSDIDELITARTKFVSLVQVSNILGTVNDTAAITQRAHEFGALMMLDGSQSVPHMPVDVADLGIDFLAFTGHKMLAPTGIGVLWGRAELLDAMPPFLGGGSMIETVTLEKTTYAAPPARFEAGTPPIVEAIGLGAAVDTCPRWRTRSGGTRRNSRRTRSTVCPPSPACGSSARIRRSAAAARSRSLSTMCIRTTSGRFSTNSVLR
jgi:cysteine desulfurase/selenocysteine lyase